MMRHDDGVQKLQEAGQRGHSRGQLLLADLSAADGSADALHAKGLSLPTDAAQSQHTSTAAAPSTLRIRIRSRVCVSESELLFKTQTRSNSCPLSS